MEIRIIKQVREINSLNTKNKSTYYFERNMKNINYINPTFEVVVSF